MTLSSHSAVLTSRQSIVMDEVVEQEWYSGSDGSDEVAHPSSEFNEMSSRRDRPHTGKRAKWRYKDMIKPPTGDVW